MKHKKAYIFDFDGTLVDSMDNFADIAGTVIAKHYGVSFEYAKSRYIETTGLPFCEQIELIFPNNQKNKMAVKTYEAKKLEKYFEEDFYPDVNETINFLKKRGIKVVVSSNNYQKVIDEYVEKKNVIFDSVLGYREGFAKGKDHFDFIKNTYNFENRDLVFIGDSLKDAERAYLNDIDFIAKIGLFSREDFKAHLKEGSRIINSLKELQEN